MAKKRSLRDKQKRLADFSRRAAFAPADVIRVNAFDWEYIPVHPFADDIQLLKKLQITPEDCFKVDCYWKAQGDVTFLQVISEKYSTNRTAGLYGRWSPGDLPFVNLVAVVEEAVIEQRTFEKVMSKFIELDVFSDSFSQSMGDSLLFLGHSS